MTFLRVVDGRATHRAEPELELRAVIPGAHELGGLTLDLEGCVEAGERGEHAAGAALTGETMAQADLRFALDLDAQLATEARSCTIRHPDTSRDRRRPRVRRSA